MTPLKFPKHITLADLENQSIEQDIEVIGKAGKWYLEVEVDIRQ